MTLDPTDSHAYGILGDAYLEVAKYEIAAHTYQRMIQLQGDLYAYSRLSGLKSVQGNTAGAIADLERAIQLGQAQERPPESIAWAMWQLGNESLALGQLPAAEASYLEALNTFSDYYRALAGLAQVRAAQQRYPEAVDLYRKAIAIVPLPDYAAALGDVYTKLGRPQDAQKQYKLVEYIGYLNTLNKVLYNRELAYFYADHDRKLPEALGLARRELEVGQDIYAHDVLAWALYKNDRLQEARTAMTEALKLGTKDARLFFHTGMIHIASRNTRRPETICGVRWRQIPTFISCIRRQPSAPSKRLRCSSTWPCSRSRPMTDKPVWWYLCLAALAVVLLAMPHLGSAHPLGNFSISHYTAICLDSDAVVLRYLIDMAEIPTFQEIQDTQIVLQEGHPSLPAYLAQRVDDLRAGLVLELNGVRLPLSSESSMDQQSFEQAVLTVLRQIPEQQRMSILKIVQTLVREHLKSEAAGHRSQSYSIEHHREIQRLTASIRGSLAEAVVAERDERG